MCCKVNAFCTVDTVVTVFLWKTTGYLPDRLFGKRPFLHRYRSLSIYSRSSTGRSAAEQRLLGDGRSRLDRFQFSASRVARLCPRPPTIVSTPSVDANPPHQSKPFVEACFGPLPVGPPARAKLYVVASRSDRERLSLDLVPEDAESAARVKIRCDDQDSGAVFANQAFLRVVRLFSGRESRNRTDSHRCTLWKTSQVLLGQLHLCELIDPHSSRNVDHHPASVPLIEELQRARGTVIGLACQDQNHVRRHWGIHHQQPAGIHAEPHKHHDQYNCENPDMPCAARLFRLRQWPVPLKSCRSGFSHYGDHTPGEGCSILSAKIEALSCFSSSIRPGQNS